MPKLRKQMSVLDTLDILCAHLLRTGAARVSSVIRLLLRIFWALHNVWKGAQTNIRGDGADRIWGDKCRIFATWAATWRLRVVAGTHHLVKNAVIASQSATSTDIHDPSSQFGFFRVVHKVWRGLERKIVGTERPKFGAINVVFSQHGPGHGAFVAGRHAPASE